MIIYFNSFYEIIEFQINDQLFFEVLQMEIRDKTISYATHKMREDTGLEKQLTEEIRILENNINANNVTLLEEKKIELQAIRNNRLEGMIAKSRVKWLQDGEKASRYFCNLENRNYTNKSTCFIQPNNGDVVFDQEEITEETKNFYVNLYSQWETIDVDLKIVALNAPLLTMEDRKIIEGQITYTEAHTAVRAMTNNKSPGSDGYTSEFYKSFSLETLDIFWFGLLTMNLKIN